MYLCQYLNCCDRTNITIKDSGMNSKFDYDLLSAMMTNANMGWWEADLKTESYICSEYISRLLGLDEDGTISFKDFNKRILKEEQRHTTTHSFNNIRQTQETVYLLNTVEGPTWIRSKICLQRTDETVMSKSTALPKHKTVPTCHRHPKPYKSVTVSSIIFINIFR